MEKTKILFVAPYVEMGTMAQKIAAIRDDVSVTVQVANLSDALSIVSGMELEQFDVVVSRGGTAKMLESHLRLPVAFVELSGYDVLRHLQLARLFEGKSAVVGFSDIADAAKLVCGLLQYKNDVFALQSSNEVEDCIQKLKKEGYGLIIGDVISTDIAARYGLKTILATSGPESIHKAFDDAIRLKKMREMILGNAACFQNMLLMQQDIMFVTDGTGEVKYKTKLIPKVIEGKIASCISLLNGENEVSIMVEADTHTYTIRGKRIHTDELYYFSVSSKPKSSFAAEGALRILNPGQTAIPTINSFVSNSHVMKQVLDNAVRNYGNAMPIFLHGNEGAGRNTLAMAIHWEGLYATSPLIILDAKETPQKMWQYLLESVNSPLLERQFSLLIKNFQDIPREVQIRLNQYIAETEMLRRCRILSVSNISPERLQTQVGFYQPLLEKICTICLRVPDLYERQEDICSLASFCLNEANLLFTKNVIGLEDEAIRALQEFSWPCNYPQLRRVINQCVLRTDEPMIQAKTVQTALAEESGVHGKATDGMISVEGTLEQISKRAIRYVLEEENMNQTKAAKRLGIGRSTMWRKLTN